MARRKMTAHYEDIDSVLKDAVGHPQGSYGDWTMGMDFNQAIDCYSGGWSEGAKRAYDLAETIKIRPTSPRQALKRSVVGGHANVGAFLAGSPVAMWNVTKENAKGKPFVHLYCQINYLGAVDAEAGFERGCAIVALADALEMAGCRVRITGIDHTESSGTYCATYALKGYGDRLDVDNVIFTLAHPAFYRCISFACREANKGSNGGSSFQAPESMMQDDGRAHNVMFQMIQPRQNKWDAKTWLATFMAQMPEEVKQWMEVA